MQEGVEVSLKGKNRAIFSYNNVERNESNFVYKDFEKTRSYHSSFVGAKFTGISFRAAHMKYCNFYFRILILLEQICVVVFLAECTLKTVFLLLLS